MNLHWFGTARNNNLKLVLGGAIVITGFVLVILQFISGINIVSGSPLAASCDNPNVPSLIESNKVMSSTLFADSNVTVRNRAGLTLTAGTKFTFCGEYNLTANGGMLHLVGTEADPIVFNSDDPSQKWGSIYFLGDASIVLTSTLRNVEINNAGGSDPNADRGAIWIQGGKAGTSGYSPVIDHVTINDSGSSGIFVRVRADDPTPPALSNLTINGSARAPLLLFASAVGGLGDGHSFSNNGKQIIEVRVGGSLGAHVDHSQMWRDQPLPYELAGTGVVNSLTIGDATNLPVLTLQPGVTLWMGEDIFIRVNSGGLIAEGTATKPISITSVAGSGPLWRQIVFEADIVPVSRLAYVNIEHAGSNAEPTLEIRDGALSLDHVTVRFNSNAPGIYSNEPMVEIKNSTIAFNKVGLQFDLGAGGLLRDNVIQGNIDAGIQVTNNTKKSCIDALGNNWGHASGPADSSNALDNCNQAKTNNGGGDTVSNDVLYDPWLGVDGLNDRSSISPDPFWVVADGLDQAQLTVTVRDASGLPLPNKMVALYSTRGVLQQLSSPTDAHGVTTAIISATVDGDAYITARNVTDDRPLAALAAIHFWSGGQDSAGLIDPGAFPMSLPSCV